MMQSYFHNSFIRIKLQNGLNKFYMQVKVYRKILKRTRVNDHTFLSERKREV